MRNQKEAVSTIDRLLWPWMVMNSANDEEMLSENVCILGLHTFASRWAWDQRVWLDDYQRTKSLRNRRINKKTADVLSFWWMCIDRAGAWHTCISSCWVAEHSGRRHAFVASDCATICHRDTHSRLPIASHFRNTRTHISEQMWMEWRLAFSANHFGPRVGVLRARQHVPAECAFLSQ